MNDQLTLQIQVMERQYEDIKKYFLLDGKVTPDEEQVLKEVRGKIDAVREKAQARAAKSKDEGNKKEAKFSKEGSKEVKTKDGFKAGAVVGLHANVAFEVGAPAGDPKRYPVKLTVSFGASAKVSGSKGAVGAEVKGSVDRTMIKEYKLSEEDLGGYVKALRAASGGSKVAAKQQEFAIIATGVSQGWEAAQQMWKGAGQPTADSVKNKGDSITVTEKDTTGANVKLKGKGVSVEAGRTNSREKVNKLTRNEKGDLVVKTDTTDKTEDNLKVGVDTGAVGVEVGKSHTVETSFGFSITVDPKKDPDGKILAWLNKCTTPEHYRAFLAANLGKVTLTEQRTGSLEAFGTSVGLSLGGRKVASIHSKKSVDEKVVRDGQGRLVKKTVTGKAGVGGEALGHSDSVEDEAVAEIDGKGKASVTMSRTTKDGDVVDKSGCKLSHNDLKVIGGIAFRSLPAWMGAVRRYQEKEHWRAAGIAIAKAKGAPSVVAEELARFVGKDEVDRREMILTWVQNGYKGVAIGRRFEFPEALKRLQESYDTVTAESLADEVNRIAKSNPAAAVDKCKGLLKIVDLLDPQIRNCEDFENKATKMEMLQRLVDSRKRIALAINGIGGQRKPEEDPALLREAANRLQKQLSSFTVEQARVGEELHNLLAGEKQFLVREKAKAKGLIRQLNDMHKRWRSDYWIMKDTMSKLGSPNWDTPMLPDDAMRTRYEKAAGLT